MTEEWESDPRLAQSGAKYRCYCGVESDYQREAKLPFMWSMAFVKVGDLHRVLYTCPRCTEERPWQPKKEQVAAAPAPVVDQTEAKLEALRNEASARGGRKKGKR